MGRWELSEGGRGKEYGENGGKVGEDGYWYVWDEVNDVYVKRGWGC